ncbi:acyl-CoA dehydrogenase family protein [Sphingobium fuliginis]|uniref:acyl-CoA dehydrogenase family protein n=1 Tax=Sphingobium fuliginis (strain ATCC 27551) TaxID=336203 RepID=UPI001ABFBF18|nr:acyl-CoA dehydrogenase family protein [Sphingobium fuliginis]
MKIDDGSQYARCEASDLTAVVSSLKFVPTDAAPHSDLALFREEVRAFLRDRLPGDLAYRPRMMMSLRDDIVRWQRILAEQGWGAPGWAREHGGAGWTIQQCLIFEEECVAAGTPTQDIVGQKLLGPVVNMFGSPEQKAQHIPLILSGERIWCQGFSEAEAGSDLASIRTKAERDGDHYVVNGQKSFVSYAHQADWIFMLVRTNSGGDKHSGISLLLADLRSPGIKVRPLRSLAGFHHINEVIFDNVHVPVENRIGEENGGWTVAKFLLDGEHAATADLAALRAYLWQLKELAGSERVGGKLLIEQHEFALRLARLEAELEAIAMMVSRVAALEQAQDHSPAARALGSMLKLRGAELQQLLTEFLMESLGDYGAIREVARGSAEDPFESLPYFAKNIASEMFFRRGSTIYGGSSEIQRTIIAKTMFGL